MLLDGQVAVAYQLVSPPPPPLPPPVNLIDHLAHSLMVFDRTASHLDFLFASSSKCMCAVSVELSHGSSDTRVVIAGGDGTVAWGFGVLDKVCTD